MASCESGALKGIFEVVCIAGGLDATGHKIVTATSSCAPRFSITAMCLNSGDIFIYCHKDGIATSKIIPWSRDDTRRPTALAFNPTSEWLLVATDDGCICIIPIGKYIEGMDTDFDHRFCTNDVIMLQPNGSRAKPTAIVWWQTLTGESSLAIIGTELGELCFVELTGGKDVGGTYITVPVRELYLCRDNSLDTVYLLITGTEDRQWRLVLEQKSSHYLFPLENISPDWGDDDTRILGSSLQHMAVVTSTPRSRLMGLKQLSVEKLQLFKQRFSEAKHSSRKKPLTENKGVDTCDLDEVPNPDTDISTSHTGNLNVVTNVLITKPATPAAEALAAFSNEIVEGSSAISSQPERLEKYIYDVVATPQYAKERYLLAGHYKPNSSLMVYSTDLENTPLYVFKLPGDTKQIVLHDELIFVTSGTDPLKLTIISTFFSASSKINGDIDAAIDPILQDIYLKEGEEILYIFPSPPFFNRDVQRIGDEKKAGDSDSDECSEVDAGLPSHTKPNGCLIVTKSSLYLCQPRKSIESLFMELTLRSGDVEAANKLGVIFSLDTKLFELAADAKLRCGSFATAILLYKYSRCSHVKCALKFAWTGFVPEFLTYMTSLTNGPDLGMEQRKHLATLAVLAHLHQLSLPAGIRSLQQQQTTLKNLLLLLRNNNYYDESLTLIFAAATWRWETLQYLASSRGLLLEKLHALLNFKNSPILTSLIPSSGEDKVKATNFVNIPMHRDSETGFLHCISDPEYRGVILFIPSLARKHMAFVLDNLDSMDKAVLRRLSSVYDPTQQAIQPFISSSSYFHKPNIFILNHNTNFPSSFLAPASDDPIGMDTLTQVFLAILIKLNEKRGWKYNPEHLYIRPVELVKKKPFYDTCIWRRILACGYGHSAVVIEGVIYTWGLGEYGVLGDGPKSSTSSQILRGIHPSLCEELAEMVHLHSPPSEFTFSNHNIKSESSTPLSEANESDCCEPKIISYLKNFKVYSLACGKSHVLAITDYGVYGWGNSRNGQVGTGNTGRYPRPVLIQSLVNEEVVVIACGQFHSLAVTNDGRLFTWGWGVHGQLGHKNVEDCLMPKQVIKLSRKKIVQAAGGYAHSVALTSRGVIYAWGCSTYGQVGTGGILKVTSPALVPIDSIVTLLTAGYFHNIAVTEDHKVYTWGSNPACLRVQSQIHRRNRNAETQKAPETEECDKLTAESKPIGDQTLTNTPKKEGDPSSLESPISNNEESLEKKTNDDDEKTLSENNNLTTINGRCNGTNGKQGSNSSQKSPCHLIDMNTVPSCHPLEVSHLLPKEVEMPHEYGVVKSIAAGNQHSLLLTTHGSLYSWGRNLSGQLGTGNRRESLTPVRILDDAFITEIACGADFNLALETHGQLWGWGSNFHSQLGYGSGCGDGKGQPGKVFMLRTSKRVLKVPHSVQSNVETPRTVANLPLIFQHAGKSHQYPHPSQQIDLNNRSILSGVQLYKLEPTCEELSEKEIMEDKDDGLYGTVTLHAALSLLHPFYTPKNVEQMLLSSQGHQALATLYTLERQHRKAMHHQLCALLSHTLVEEIPLTVADNSGRSQDVNNLKKSLGDEVVPLDVNLDNETSAAPANAESELLSKPHSSRHVDEAVKILDHYLRLQTEESQSGMRGVLQEGIGLWLTHSLPIPQLEDLLLTHLPRTVYPLALLLFGDESYSQNKSVDLQEHDKNVEVQQSKLEEETTKVLSQLSTKFCLNLCSSVISHLQAGECNMEQLDALSQLVKVTPSTVPAKDTTSGAILGSESTPYNTLIETVSKNSPDVINLSPEEVSVLKMANKGLEDEKVKGLDGAISEELGAYSKTKKEQSKRKSLDKDCVLFTCGHHFTTKDFKSKVLPQLEKTVTTVPGLLGKTARVLLDQYHSDQPQMACPHCVLAHLTIKLTKHNLPSPT